MTWSDIHMIGYFVLRTWLPAPSQRLGGTRPILLLVHWNERTEVLVDWARPSHKTVRVDEESYVWTWYSCKAA